MIQKKENSTLDIVKFSASILVVMAHMPMLFRKEIIGTFYLGWFCRFCVPFFFAATGYFFSRSRHKDQYLKRIAWLFALSYLLYLPAILGNSGSITEVLSRLRWNLIIGYEHLWYLSAAFAGLIIWYLMERFPLLSRILRRVELPVSIVLLLLGAVLDTHYLLLDSVILRRAGDFLASFGGPRNVIFMGLPLMLLGGCIARNEERIRRIPTGLLIFMWIVFRILSFAEFAYLYSELGAGANSDMTFFSMWPGLILLELSFRLQIPLKEQYAKFLRKLSEYIYILHPLVMQQISLCISVTPVIQLLLTILLCILFYVIMAQQFPSKK